MNKQISLFLILIFSCLNLYAQTEKSVAPVNWERYKVSEREISLELPKMPVAQKSGNYCSEIIKDSYAVYAEQAVYQFVVASKSKQKIPGNCNEKEKFNKNAFENRIKELERLSEKSNEIKSTIGNREVIKINGKLTTYWIFNDLENDKWLELMVTNREDVSPHEERFIKSVQFSKNLNGIEIGNGAPRTLGDESDSSATIETANHNADSEQTLPIVIAFKPRANYTDVARQANIQGAVVLRVTFLANGEIGNIAIVNGLPYGLTEQAVKAASRIVFIPLKAKGKPISITKQLQYSFSIY